MGALPIDKDNEQEPTGELRLDDDTDSLLVGQGSDRCVISVSHDEGLMPNPEGPGGQSSGKQAVTKSPHAQTPARLAAGHREALTVAPGPQSMSRDPLMKTRQGDGRVVLHRTGHTRPPSITKLAVWGLRETPLT